MGEVEGEALVLIDADDDEGMDMMVFMTMGSLF